MAAERAPAHRGLDALDEHEVARRARSAALRRSRPSATRSRAGRSWSRRIVGPVGLEVVELLGVQAREAPGAERAGEEGDGARGRVAGVVPALERAHHRRGPEAVGTAIPDQWLHPNHRTSWGDGRNRARAAPPWRRGAPDGSPRCARSEHVDGVFACTRKERQISRAGAPYLTVELRDSTGTILGARVPRRRPARRALRARRPRARQRPRRALPRASCRSRCARSRAPRAPRPTRELPAGRLPRPRRARRLPRAPRAGGLRPSALRALLQSRSRTTRACAQQIRRAPCSLPARRTGRRARGPVHHAYLGGLLEHTVAVAHAGARAVHRCTPAWTATCC